MSNNNKKSKVMPQGIGTYGSQVGRPPEDEYNKKAPTEYAPFKMKAADYGNSPMLMNFGVGGSTEGGVSPGKFLGGIMNKVRAMRGGAKPPAEAAVANVAENTADPSTPNVPPHGQESHTGGGAIGGEPQGGAAAGIWNVGTAIGEMEGMDRIGRQEYMQGLDPEQQSRIHNQQMRDRMKRKKDTSGFTGMFSDARLKENINKTGISPSGIPIYEFNYIGDTNRYSGAMAQDLLETNPDAVSMDTSGYYKVNYNNIDVDMHLLN